MMKTRTTTHISSVQSATRSTRFRSGKTSCAARLAVVTRASLTRADWIAWRVAGGSLRYGNFAVSQTFGVLKMDAIFAAIDLTTVAAAVVLIGVAVIGITMAFKGIDLGKRGVKKV